MAISLVGTIGTAIQGTAANPISPTPGTGESRTAGNLLVLFVAGTAAATLPSAPSGYNVGIQKAGTSCSASVFWKIAAGGDTTPTINGVTSVVLAGQFAEFTGNDASPGDQTANASGTSSPITATAGTADTTSGELWVMVGADFRSVARATNDTWTSNHGTVTAAGNINGTSSVNHYSFGYIPATSSNSGGNTAVMTLSITTSITGLAVAAMSFLLPVIPNPAYYRPMPPFLAQ